VGFCGWTRTNGPLHCAALPLPCAGLPQRGCRILALLGLPGDVSTAQKLIHSAYLLRIEPCFPPRHDPCLDEVSQVTTIPNTDLPRCYQLDTFTITTNKDSCQRQLSIDGSRQTTQTTPGQLMIDDSRQTKLPTVKMKTGGGCWGAHPPPKSRAVYFRQRILNE